MTYGLLFHPGHNRVYFDTSVALSISEFTIVSAKMPSHPENIRLEEIEGLEFLLFDTAEGLTKEDTDILCDLSFLYAIFEITGEGSLRLMKPVRKTRVDFVDDSISQILKYTGKTNEIFTRMMIKFRFRIFLACPLLRSMAMYTVLKKVTTRVRISTWK